MPASIPEEKTEHSEFSKKTRVWVPHQEDGWLPGICKYYLEIFLRYAKAF
jgi:hypothetical protein